MSALARHWRRLAPQARRGALRAADALALLHTAEQTGQRRKLDRWLRPLLLQGGADPAAPARSHRLEPASALEGGELLPGLRLELEDLGGVGSFLA
jgi:hypothetical protein